MESILSNNPMLVPLLAVVLLVAETKPPPSRSFSLKFDGNPVTLFALVAPAWNRPFS
jgi:hypothetical protein